jgi:cytidylate kinase
MLNKKRINIAIDGPSGVGKSVISKMLAKKLNYKFLSSGNFYRIVAYNIIQKNIDPNISKNIISSTDFSLIEILEDETILYNKKDITKEIREDEVSKIASIIAKYQPLREKINHFIQEYSKKNSGIIVDGRDATYRILPNAEAKFFM